MSPKSSLTLMVALFLAAISLADDHPKPHIKGSSKPHETHRLPAYVMPLASTTNSTKSNIASHHRSPNKLPSARYQPSTTLHNELALTRKKLHGGRHLSHARANEEENYRNCKNKLGGFDISKVVKKEKSKNKLSVIEEAAKDKHAHIKPRIGN